MPPREEFSNRNISFGICERKNLRLHVKAVAYIVAFLQWSDLLRSLAGSCRCLAGGYLDHKFNCRSI